MDPQPLYRVAAVLSAAAICAQVPAVVVLGGSANWAVVCVAWVILCACLVGERLDAYKETSQ